MSTQNQVKRGKFIALEGLDRSGKSTQCSRLVTHLRNENHQVEHLRFPDRTTPTGQIIASYLTGSVQLDDRAIHLLFSANRWEKAKQIGSLIENGVDVVCDRYYYSGCVYTAAKGIEGMDLDWCRNPETGLPRPDVCIFLDVSAEVAEQRGGFGGERYEKAEMQARVRSLFGELREHPDEESDIVTVDASADVDEVEQAIKEVVEKASFLVEETMTPLRKVAPW
ncbi:thymidylate kinase [Hortaea werneckii]|nr:thymidylate kinase [Hortaea werneckii]